MGDKLPFWKVYLPLLILASRNSWRVLEKTSGFLYTCSMPRNKGQKSLLEHDHLCFILTSPSFQGEKIGRQLFILIAWPLGSPHFASMPFFKNHIYFSNVCKLKTSEELCCLGEHNKSLWKFESCLSVIHLETHELNVRIFQLPRCFKSLSIGVFNQLMGLINVYSIWRQMIFLWRFNDGNHLSNVYK